MSKPIEFVLELTRDEARALLLLARSSVRRGGDFSILPEIYAIGNALDDADLTGKLNLEQFALYKKHLGMSFAI